MSRTLSAAEITASQDGHVRFVLFAEMDFSGGTEYIHQGGRASYLVDGNTYTNVGDLGSITPITESADTTANGLTLTLSGVSSSWLSTVQTEDYLGRSVTISLGMLDENWGLIDSTPMVAWKGRMDHAEILLSGETGSISLHCENALIDSKRARVRRYTQADHEEEYASDNAFRGIVHLATREVQWGGGRVFIGTGGSGGEPGSAAPGRSGIPGVDLNEIELPPIPGPF